MPGPVHRHPSGILSLQHESYGLEHDLGVLASRIGKKFILLVPTIAHLDAACREILKNAGAECFSLEHNLILTPNGKLEPTRLPGEIFAHFRPEPADTLAKLRTFIALAKAADAGQGARKVTLYMVMRLYCFDLQNPAQITKTCGCSLALVYSRLVELGQKLKCHPAELRIYSSQFQTLDDALTDPRADHISRKDAINGDEDLGDNPR
jgi:hypothetical protein